MLGQVFPTTAPPRNSVRDEDDAAASGGGRGGVCPARRAPPLRWAGFGSCVDEKRDPFHVAKISNQINPAPPTTSSFSLLLSQKEAKSKQRSGKFRIRRQAERRSIAHTTSQEEKVGLSNPILPERSLASSY